MIDLITLGRELDNSNAYLMFQDVTPEGRKTNIIEVIVARSGDPLGRIAWWGPWRQYTFQPEGQTIFNSACLETILANVKVMNALRKKP